LLSLKYDPGRTSLFSSDRVSILERIPVLALPQKLEETVDLIFAKAFKVLPHVEVSLSNCGPELNKNLLDRNYAALLLRLPGQNLQPVENAPHPIFLPQPVTSLPEALLGAQLDETFI